jgi:hypothetical protein
MFLEEFLDETGKCRTHYQQAWFIRHGLRDGLFTEEQARLMTVRNDMRLD